MPADGPDTKRKMGVLRPEAINRCTTRTIHTPFTPNSGKAWLRAKLGRIDKFEWVEVVGRTSGRLSEEHGRLRAWGLCFSFGC